MAKLSLPTIAEARRHLAHHYRRPDLDVVEAGRGEWSRAYGFSLDGRRLVARFGPYREDFLKDRLIADLAPAGVPVPKVWAFAEVEGGYFQVADWVPGGFLDNVDAAHLTELLPDLLQIMDGVGAMAVPGRAGFGPFAPDARAPHATWQDALLAVAVDDSSLRVHGWRERLLHSPVGSGPFDEAVSALARLAPDLPNLAGLVHQDLLHRNVFCVKGHITGLIDWGNALFGDPLYDWAWLLYWMPLNPPWSRLDLQAAFRRHWESHEGPPPDAARRLHAYQIHIGLDAQAYNAYQGRFEELACYAERTLALARSAS